ncbi:hypothetical protein QBC40DRAFT_264652 [Triangularia verruculosa]|uniref:NAD(P)-binding domain-containing protein n=1 Tax=Triangularia verruculosa TaxID=2587418 RepID=A0AAN6XLZ4_9PEZI|nr:hypothetical protein QBC40DRAFT_264652 [Triangularia verruculosa]
MKLIVAGSTGFVGAEIIHQALSNPRVTSLIALGRRPAPIPKDLGPNADSSKLKSVIIDDLGADYPDSAKQELSGADACIWTIGITPAKSRTYTWEQTVKVCRDYTIKGIETISQLSGDGASGKPFRFLYMSGYNCERDQTKKPMWPLRDYLLMRGGVESRILEFAQQSNGAVEAVIAKPGLITGYGKIVPVVQRAVMTAIGVPKISVQEISAALLDQAESGFEKDTLMSEDMSRIAARTRERE